MRVRWIISDRLMLTATVGFLLVSILVLLLSIGRQDNAGLLQKLREVRISKTRAAIALSVLQESNQIKHVSADTPDSVEVLTLRLIEALSSDIVSGLVTIQASSVDKTNRAAVFIDDSENPLYSLSVSIRAVAQEADVLLTIMQQLKEAAQWRPIELRSCAFGKKEKRNAVGFTCLIDVYYFPDYKERQANADR